MNWLATQHDSRRDGQSRSYRGRVALRTTATTVRGMLPQSPVAIDCAAKRFGLEGRSWESPG